MVFVRNQNVRLSDKTSPQLSSESTLPLTTSRPDEECTIQHTHIKKTYMYSTSDVSTHVHVTQHTCTKAVHVSTHVHVTQNVHASTIKIIPGLIDQPSVQNLQAL